jgi:hypothetical protein
LIPIDVESKKEEEEEIIIWQWKIKHTIKPEVLAAACRTSRGELLKAYTNIELQANNFVPVDLSRDVIVLKNFEDEYINPGFEALFTLFRSSLKAVRRLAIAHRYFEFDSLVNLRQIPLLELIVVVPDRANAREWDCNTILRNVERGDCDSTASELLDKVQSLYKDPESDPNAQQLGQPLPKPTDLEPTTTHIRLAERRYVTSEKNSRQLGFFTKTPL